jgi:plasmid replication initiation protein
MVQYGMKKENLKVFQSNKFTESRQGFSLNEKRVMQFIIAKIKPTDRDFKEYVIPIVEIADMANIDSKNMYKEGKRLMSSMLGKFILLEDENSRKLKGFNYFHHLSYDDGKISVRLHEFVHELFLQLKEDKINFTAYELTEFMTLPSTYAQRIYELLKQYGRSKGRERTIKLSLLREMLDIEDNKYMRFGNFKSRVLDLSKKLIEEHTTLRFDYKTVCRRGRKVDSIRFYKIRIEGEDLSAIQEDELMKNYIGDEIYNEEFNTYLKIKNVERIGNSGRFNIQSEFDEEWYEYGSAMKIQESIARALTHRALIDF